MKHRTYSKGLPLFTCWWNSSFEDLSSTAFPSSDNIVYDLFIPKIILLCNKSNSTMLVATITIIIIDIMCICKYLSRICIIENNLLCSGKGCLGNRTNTKPTSLRLLLQKKKSLSHTALLYNTMIKACFSLRNNISVKLKDTFLIRWRTLL